MNCTHIVAVVIKSLSISFPYVRAHSRLLPMVCHVYILSALHVTYDEGVLTEYLRGGERLSITA